MSIGTRYILQMELGESWWNDTDTAKPHYPEKNVSKLELVG
jgi:hypothetical protein